MAEEILTAEEKNATNESDAAIAAGKAPPEKKEPEAAKLEEKEAPESPRLPRSTVRELNRLREEAAGNKARAEQLQDLIDRGLIQAGSAKVGKGEDDPEPTRKDFASDAEYNRAVGRWDARQESKKVLGTVTEQRDQEQQLSQLRTTINEADEAAAKDIKDLLPDYQKVAEEADLEFKPAEHPQLSIMLAQSPMKARIMYAWAKDEEAFEAMLKLTKTPEKQIAAFHRLEGKMETLYEKKEPAKESKEERDAKKAKPSSEVSARGGLPTPGDIEMLLPNGDLNPAWKAKRNAEDRAR